MAHIEIIDRPIASDRVGDPVEELRPADAPGSVPKGAEAVPHRASAPPATPPSAIAREVAEQLSRGADGTVELQLSPEELGRVRLTLTTVDGGIAVSVSADRAETMDLLRRNIDLLGRDFREQGYGSVSFSFDQRGGQPRAGRGAQTGPEDSPATVPEPVTSRRTGSTTRLGTDQLDIRL